MSEGARSFINHSKLPSFLNHPDIVDQWVFFPRFHIVCWFAGGARQGKAGSGNFWGKNKTGKTSGNRQNSPLDTSGFTAIGRGFSVINCLSPVFTIAKNHSATQQLPGSWVCQVSNARNSIDARAGNLLSKSVSLNDDKCTRCLIGITMQPSLRDYMSVEDQIQIKMRKHQQVCWEQPINHKSSAEYKYCYELKIYSIKI